MKSGFIDKIKANKHVLIQELVDEFGTEYEELLNSRFDKIKFVFFVDIPDFKKELNKMYSKIRALKVKDFIAKNQLIDNVVIDDKVKDFVGYQILPNDEQRKKFKSIFGRHYIDFNFEDEEEHRSLYGIFSFSKTQNYERLTRAAQSRNMTVDKFIVNNRCEFLKDIGLYPNNYINDMIISDPSYERYCTYYSRLMDEYDRITIEVKKEFNKDFEQYNKLVKLRKKIYQDCYKNMLETDLFPFLSEKDRNIIINNNYELSDIEFLNFFFNIGQELYESSKLENASDIEMAKLLFIYYQENIPDNLKEKVKEFRDKACKQFFNEIKKVFILECNCDIAEIELDFDISITMGTMTAKFVQEDGEEKSRYIFFSPYACDDSNYDVHLRHELRHSLTSSVRKEGEYVVVKVGNQENYYLKNELIRSDNEFYNELITQQRSLENTQKSFDKGIYILSHQGSIIKNGETSYYDWYLDNFSDIFEILPEYALLSQIEKSNDMLYSFLTIEDIRSIENVLYSGGSMVEICNKIKSKQKEQLSAKIK